ncbi:MAG: hypothetical protein AB7P49_00180 [Bdellovibrionales bacterium]
MEIHVEGTYHGFLNGVEKSPVADIWLSSPDPSRSVMKTLSLENSTDRPIENEIGRVLHRFWETVAFQGRMRRHTSYFTSSVVLQWDPQSVPVDTALHFQVFVALDEDELEKPNLGIIPAGSAHAHLQELVESELLVLPIMHQSLQDEMLYSDSPDTIKGVLVLKIKDGFVPDIRFDDPVEHAIVRSNSNRIRDQIRSVIAQRTNRATAGLDNGLRMPPTLPEMIRVRAEDYATPAGVNLLDNEFFSMCNVPDADSDTVWLYMERAAQQQGWTPETFGRRLRESVDSPVPMTLEGYLAQEVFVRGLTMLANAIYYSSDYAVIHDRGLLKLTVVESFDDALRRGVCDCEDDGKLEAGIFLFLRDKATATSDWQRSVQYFSRGFVCVVTLRSVCSAALDHVRAVNSDVVISLLEPVRMDQAGAHMHLVLYPVHAFEKFCKNGHAGIDKIKAPITAVKPTRSENLHVLFCEGTGPMSPFVYNASKYIEESAGETWQRIQIAAEHVLTHQSMQMLSRFIPMHITPSEPIPASLRFLRKARQVLRKDVNKDDTAHNFYRLAADGFVPGMGVGGFTDADGRPMTFSKFTYCLKDGSGKISRGVPIMVEAEQSERVAFRFFSDPGPSVNEITARTRQHLPPATRVDASNPPDDFVEMARNVKAIFMDEVGDRAYKVVDAIVNEDVGLFNSEGIVVVLHRFVRTTSLTPERIRAVANLVRMNNAILRVSVSSAFLGPTAWQTDFIFEVFVSMDVFEATVLP